MVRGLQLSYILLSQARRTPPKRPCNNMLAHDATQALANDFLRLSVLRDMMLCRIVGWSFRMPLPLPSMHDQDDKIGHTTRLSTGGSLFSRFDKLLCTGSTYVYEVWCLSTDYTTLRSLCPARRVQRHRHHDRFSAVRPPQLPIDHGQSSGQSSVCREVHRDYTGYFLLSACL